MIKSLLKILITILIFFFYIAVETENTYAQYCGGSVSCCANYETVRTPSGCKTSCSAADPDCVKCTGETKTCTSHAGSGACTSSGAGSGGPVCFDNCNGVIESGGCTAYTPPPPPPPPVITTPRPTPRPTVNTIPSTPPPSQQPAPPPPPPPMGYMCTCGGCVPSTYSAQDAFACQQSCTLPGSDACGAPDDTSAGAPSCPELQDTAADAIVWPGTTRTWRTWDPVNSTDKNVRLNNPSPGMSYKSYTSPGDILTFTFMFQEPESQAHTYYVFDDDDKTWFFFQGQNKPPVIFTLSSEVVKNAKKIGYTQITDQSTANANNASQILKRVYLLTQDAGQSNPWKTSSGSIKGVVSHLPRGIYMLPYVNCASALMADDHNYFGTISSKNIEQYCFGRQTITYRKNNDNVYEMAGNYAGLEYDWYRSDWGTDNSGDQIWPRTDLHNSGENYGRMAHAFLWEKALWENDDTSQGSFRPGYIRMPVMQLPTQVFVAEKLHDLYTFTEMGVPKGTPVGDENDSDACMLNRDGNAKGYQYTKYKFTDPLCSGFKVVDTATNTKLSAGDKVRIGRKYQVSTIAQNSSQLYSFYNQNFNAPDISPDEIDNWQKSNGISTFRVVNCDSNGNTCPNGATDNKVLEVAQTPNAQSNATVETQFIETNTSLTDKTFTVEFWARVNSATPKVIPYIELQRAPHNPIADPSVQNPYDEIEHPSDWARLRFSNNTGDFSTTDSITVTNTWDKYSGTVTFPDTHPLGNISSRVKLVLRAPNDGTSIFYDNFNNIGYTQPDVYFRMVSANHPSSNPSYNRCSLSTHAGGTQTNGSGGLFWADLDLTQSGLNLQPGIHNIFAIMQTGPQFSYSGNPNSVSACGINSQEWDDSIASTCSLQVELAACNENTPAKPTFAQPIGYTGHVYSGGGIVPGYHPIENQITEMYVQGTTLPISVAHSGSNITRMQLDIYKKDPVTGTVTNTGTTLTKHLSEARVVSGQYIFDFEYAPQETLTNQISITATAIHDESCASSTGELQSTPLNSDIVMLGISSGRFYEVSRGYLNSLTCRETYSDYLSSSGGLNIINPTSLGGKDILRIFTNQDTTPDNYHNYTQEPTYDRFKNMYSQFFNLLLPYNPTNNLAWWNQVNFIELQLPTPSSDQGYICACNKTSGSDTLCRKPVTTPDNEGNIFNSVTYDETNFFLVKGSFIYDSWWQTKGGLVAAINDSTNSIYSSLPIFNLNPSTNCAADSNCQPYLNSRANLSLNNSAGIVYTNGSVQTSPPNGIGGYISQQSTNPYVDLANTNHLNTEENYNYFTGLIDFNDPNKINQISISDQFNYYMINPHLLKKYDAAENVVIIRIPSEIQLDIGSTLQVLNGYKVILFVDGDLIINGSVDTKLLDVDENSFFMAVADNNITFSNTIGYTDANQTEPIVEGVFVADNQLIIQEKAATDPTQPTETADLKFIGAGSYIGLGGVQLQRTFDSPTDVLAREKNSFSPVEQFIFRPDFVLNAPDILKRPELTWKETN